MAFENRQVDGLFQKTRGGVWFVRRVVPQKPEYLRERLGRANWVASTKTPDYGRARHVRADLWAKWDAEIDEARRLGEGVAWDLARTLEEVEGWRWSRCSILGGYDAVMEDDTGRVLVHRTYGGKLGLVWRSEPISVPSADTTAPLDPAAASWARWYFDEFPLAPRGPALPHETAVLLGRLQVAARDPGGWVGVQGFDEAMMAAIQEDQDGPVLIPAKVQEAARQPFARAWLEVEQYQEAERRRADSILAALELATAVPTAIRVEAQASAFIPREDDRTVSEVVEAFRAHQNDPALYKKQFGHIGRALTEIVGADKPIRALTKSDVRDVYRFLCTLPPHVSKTYKGVPLVVAAERAAEAGGAVISPNTVRSYMISFKGICAFAMDPERGWIDANPVDGEVPGKRNLIRRRGLTPAELAKVFSALEQERRVDSVHFWAPAVLAFTGARANEICQLHVDDIKATEGVPYIDLSEFDEEGRRLDRRRLKTADSARCIPIHDELVAAGFLDFVARRRGAGEERLFPELRKNVLGYWSHEVSRRWGRLLDSVGLSEPALTLHGLRHGWKDSADSARLPGYILAALGGWGGGKSAMFAYGDRCSARRVPENAEHVRLITLGGFKLGAAPGAVEA
jgi:integrase